MTSFNLCYDDHVKNLTSGLQSMLNTSCFSDVTLAVDGKLFKAHQVVLAMRSAYFEELFISNDCQNNHVTVCIMDVKHEIMQALLTFMYEGNVKIQAKYFDLLLTTANELEIKGLESDSQNDEKSVVHSATVNKLDAPETKRECEETDALPLITVTREELFNCSSDVSLNEEDTDMNMSVIPKALIENHQTSLQKFTAHRNNSMSTVQHSDNMSMKGDDAHMDIGFTEIQYPTGADDHDDNDDRIECEDILGSNDSSGFVADSIGEGHISTNKSGIADVNVPKSLNSYCDKNTGKSMEEGCFLVTVSFLKSDLHETRSSILLNDSLFLPVRKNTWKCAYWTHSKCPASIVLTLDKHIVLNDQHNHAVEKSLHQSAIASQETYIIRSLAQRRSNRRKASQICNVKTSMNTALANSDSASVTVSFIKSQRRNGWGGIIANEIRYAWYSDQKIKLWTKWVCSVQSTYKCKAYVILTKDQHIIFFKQHNHRQRKSLAEVTDLQRTYNIALNENWCDIKLKLYTSYDSLNKLTGNDITCGLQSTSDSGGLDVDCANILADSFVESAKANVNDHQISSILQCDMETDKRTVENANNPVCDDESLEINPTVDDIKGGSFDFEESDVDPDNILDSKDNSDSDENFQDSQDSTNSNQKCLSTLNTVNMNETVGHDVGMPSSLQSNGEKVNDRLYTQSSPNRWKCSSRRKCRARIVLTKDKCIAFVENHNHAVPKGSMPRVVISSEPYTIIPYKTLTTARICEADQIPMETTFTDGDFVKVSFIKSLTKEGWSAIMVNEIRYTTLGSYSSKVFSHWHCSMHKTYKCRAYIILTKDRRIVFVKQHNHTQRKRHPVVTDMQRTYRVLLQATWHNVKKKRANRIIPICEMEQTPLEASYAQGDSVKVSFIKSSRKEGWGGIIVNGWRYSRCRFPKPQPWSYWICPQRARHNCYAYVILTKDQRIVFGKQHKHQSLNKLSAVIDSERTYNVLLNKSWIEVRKKWKCPLQHSSNKLGKNDETCRVRSASVSNNLHDVDINTHGQCAEAKRDKTQRSSILQCDGETDKSAEASANHAPVIRDTRRISILQCDRETDKNAESDVNYPVIGDQSVEIDPTVNDADGDGSDFEDSDADPDYILDAKGSSESDENFHAPQDNSNSKQKCRSLLNTVSTNETENVTDIVEMPSSLQSDGEKVIVSFFKTYENQKFFSVMVNNVRYRASSRNTWICRKPTNCRARVVLTNDKCIAFVHEHNHAVEKRTLPMVIHFSEPYTIIPFARLKAGRICETAQEPMEASLTDGESVEVSFIKSLTKESSSAMVVNEIRYRFKWEQTDKLWSTWLCSVNNTYNCKALVILTKDQRIVFVKQHTHRPFNKRKPVTNSQRTYRVLLQDKWPKVKAKLVKHSRNVRVCEEEQALLEATFTEGEAVSVSFIKSLVREDDWGAIIVNGLRYSRGPLTLKLWTAWVCSGRRTYDCQAKIILTKDLRIVFRKQHNHRPLNKRSAVIDSECTYRVLLNKSWHSVKKKLISHTARITPLFKYGRESESDVESSVNHDSVTGVKSTETEPTGADDAECYSEFENSDADPDYMPNCK